MKSGFLCLLVLTTLFVSCSKEKRFSKRLMKGETWQVTEVVVSGEKSTLLGSWLITSDVDIYDSIPSTNWTMNTFDASFVWQFQNKGKEFEIQYTPECVECEDNGLDTLDVFANALSGKYKVEKHGLKKMIFKSSATKGWNGSEVSITIEK